MPAPLAPDPQNFAQQYDRYSAMLFRLCLLYLKNTADAEDAVQEAFVRLYARAPQFRDEAHERRWLCRVAVNLCKNMLRTRARHPTAPLEEAMTAAAPPPEQAVLEQVLALPEAYRPAVVLHYYEGYSVEETARILQLRPGAVKMRLLRARAALRLELEQEDEAVPRVGKGRRS